MGEGVRYGAMGGNQTWDGEHVTEGIDVVLQIRTPET